MFREKQLLIAYLALSFPYKNIQLMQDKTAGIGLKKSFGLKMAIIIVISAIVGSGVFKKAAPMAELLHVPGLVVLAWFLAGIIILFGILSIAELSALFPASGGPFLWLEKIYGKQLSFFYGWSCFTVIQTAAIASVAFVFAGALDTFFTLSAFISGYRIDTFPGFLSPEKYWCQDRCGITYCCADHCQYQGREKRR
jgi:Amino acid transporters